MLDDQYREVLSRKARPRWPGSMALAQWRASGSRSAHAARQPLQRRRLHATLDPAGVAPIEALGEHGRDAPIGRPSGGHGVSICSLAGERGAARLTIPRPSVPSRRSGAAAGRRIRCALERERQVQPGAAFFARPQLHTSVHLVAQRVPPSGSASYARPRSGSLRDALELDLSGLRS